MKRRVRLAALVVVIAAMVVALVLLQNRPDEPPRADDPPAPAAEPDERVTLLSNPRDAIARVEVETGTGSLSIVRVDEESFRPVYEYDVEFDTRQVNRIVGGASSLSSRRTIGEVADLSEFGLDSPQASVTVVRDDGSDQSIVIGNRTPAQDAYYVRRPDEETVYTVFNTWITPFFTTVDQLRVRELPQIVAESLERVIVETPTGRTIRATKVPEWDESPELGFAVFQIVEPFERRFQANTNWFEELNTNLAELAIERFVDDAPTSLAQYGLTPPEARLLVEDEETTLELLIGSNTDGGRFAKLADSPSVFILSGIEPIITVRPYETISPFALIINIDQVETFVVDGPDGTRYTGRIERTPIEGEDEPEETYFLNDRQIDEDLFKDLYQWAIGLQFDAEIASSEASGTTPVAERDPIADWILLNNIDPGSLSVSFVPYNANFAAVVRDSVSEFLLARSKIDRMLEAFEEAAANL